MDQVDGESSAAGDELAAELTDEELADQEELVERLQAEYRAHGGDLERRHWVQAFATLGLVESGARQMYRREVLEAIPSLRVRTSEEGADWDVSWEPEAADVPDGVIDAGGYAALLALASVGSDTRAKDQPYLSIAAAGLSIFYAATSLRELIGELEAGEVDAFSSIDTIMSAATVPLVLPEAVRAVKGLLGRD